MSQHNKEILNRLYKFKEDHYLYNDHFFILNGVFERKEPNKKADYVGHFTSLYNSSIKIRYSLSKLDLLNKDVEDMIIRDFKLTNLLR